MRRELSTPYFFVYRWIIPGALTIVAVALILYFAGPTESGARNTGSILGGALSAALLVVFARLYDRAKRVWIDGDHLVINDSNQTIQVPLTDIESVGQLFLFGPERITVRFRTTTAFGNRVMFFPPLRWPQPLRHPLVAELSGLIAARSAS